MAKSSPAGAQSDWTVEKAAADLRQRIRSGEFGTPDASGKLPTAGALAEHYRLSRQAINRVIGMLKTEGLIESHAGARGGAAVKWGQPTLFAPQHYFGWQPAAEVHNVSNLVQARSPHVRVDDVTVMPAPEAIRLRMGLQAGEHVAVRKRTSIVDGEEAHTDDAYVPLKLVDGTDWLLPGSLACGADLVLAGLGHDIVRSVDELQLRTTTDDETRRLGGGTPVPALELASTGFDHADRPVQVRVITLPQLRYAVVYDRRKPS